MSPASNCAAFFDLDGTLLAPPSLEQRFIRYLLARGELGITAGLRWFEQFLRQIGSDPHAATEANKAYLTGLPVTLADDWAAWSASETLPVFAEGLRRLDWHAAQGHKIVLLSGTLFPLAQAIANRLPVPVLVCATELESHDGYWTGYPRGELVSGDQKARAAARLASQYGMDLGGSFAYADRISDCAILSSVSFPVAVNASPLLERLANLRGWPILEWHKKTSATVSPVPVAFRTPQSVSQFQVKR
jgi:HAD superfamily hydrolase (TIGR01490 family)